MQVKVVVWYLETIVSGDMGVAQERHAGFGWCPSSFPAIAWYACANYVFPAMLSATTSWYDMI